jgi:hypothetical protein
MGPPKIQMILSDEDLDTIYIYIVTTRPMKLTFSSG